MTTPVRAGRVLQGSLPGAVWRAVFAYVAAAWVVVQLADVLGDTWGWSPGAQQALQVLLVGGLLTTAVVAWFHPERELPRVRPLEVALVLLVMAASLGGAGWRWSAADAAALAAAPAELPSVAVLPFEYDGNGDGDGVFAAGMQGEIASRLASVGGLRVVTDVPSHDGVPLQERVRRAGATHLIVGRLERRGESLTARVRLLSTDRERDVWSRTYRGNLSPDHLLDVQRQVAAEVAASLRGRLTVEETAGMEGAVVRDLEAYRSYLEGSALFEDRLDRGSMEGAVQAFEAALAREPDFPAALGSLVHAWAWISWQFREPEAQAAARSYLDRLYALDPARIETHMASAYYHYYATRDFDSALRELRVVVRGRPGDVWAWAVKGYVERRLGMWETSLDSQGRATELDPREPQVAYNLGRTLHRLGRYAEAEVHLRRAHNLAPDRSLYVRALLDLDHARGDTAAMARTLALGGEGLAPGALLREEAELLSRQGRHREALEVWDAARERQRAGSWNRTAALLAWLAGDGARVRVHADSLRAIAELELAEARAAGGGARAHVVLGELALAHALLGDRDLARTFAERAADPLVLTPDAYDGPGDVYDLAVTYAVMGDADAAVDLLARILDAPSIYSRAAFDATPAFAALQAHAGYQELPEGWGPLR